MYIHLNSVNCNYIEILKSQERINKISVHNALEQQNISTFLLKQIYFEILIIFRG